MEEEPVSDPPGVRSQIPIRDHAANTGHQQIDIELLVKIREVQWETILGEQRSPAVAAPE